MERVSAAEKAVIGNKGEKKGHKSKKDKGKRKGKKDKAQGHGGDGDGSIQSDDMNHSVEIKQAEVLVEMAEKPCLEHTEDIASKNDVKEHRKKKKKDKEADTISQKQILAVNDERVGSGYLERSMGKGEHHSVSKKGKQKHQDAETSLNGSCDDKIISRGDKKKKRKERSDTPEEVNEADMSMMGQKADGKKKRRKERDNVGVDLSQNIAAGNGNSRNKEEKASKDGSGYLERSIGKGEHGSMSKGKQKNQDGETSLNGSCDDQIISRGDKKKKRKEHSDTLEDGNEADMSMMGQKMEGKKKRRKERGNVGVDLSQNIPAGNGNSCNKDEKASEDDNGGGKSKKVNVAHGKDKGKRVSFTDDVEVYKIDGGDGDEEGDGSDDSELVHGQRFTPEEDVKLMEAIQEYSEVSSFPL
jgi:hypothetical protein